MKNLQLTARKNQKTHQTGRPLLLLFMALTMSGCVVGETINYLATAGTGNFERISKQKAVERVARDWCLTIRGSQVIPVYPLDEDVQPGDVYISSTPVAEMKTFWNQRGYLPIDHRFARFYPTGYKEYYKDGYGIKDATVVPRHWQFPNGNGITGVDAAKGDTHAPTAGTPAQTAANVKEGGTNKMDQDSFFTKTAWPGAPRAGFPSQTIRIKRGEGFNCALPLQGVPVALGALGARESTATVALSDAYTYGVDEVSLRNDLYAWLGKDAQVQRYIDDYRSEAAPAQRGWLKSTKAKSSYLRLITRVYLVRSVDVSITSNSASDWKVSAGAPKEGASAAKNLGEGTEGKEDEDELLNSLRLLMASEALDKTPAQPAKPPGEPGGGGEAAPAAPAAADDLEGLAFEDPKLQDRLEALRKQRAALILQQKEQDTQAQVAKLEREQQRQVVEHDMIQRHLSRSLMEDKFGGYQLPGGTLRVTSSTHRSISMKETFTRPLVIGYHALDFRIESDGRLSAPVSTFSRVSFDKEPPPTFVPTYAFDDINRKLLKWVGKSTDNQDTLDRWMRLHKVPEDQLDKVLDSDRWRTELELFYAAHRHLIG